MQFIDKLRLNAGVWLRERKERTAAKATAAAMNSEHGHGRFFLLTVPAMATICAAIVEWYWAILFCIEATGRIDWNYETAFGTAQRTEAIWNFAFATHWPVFLGLVAATIPIVMLSMVWLPVQFAMRSAGMWRRGTVIAVGVLANILVIVSGTVVMNYNRQDQVRADLVVEQQAQANRGAIEAQIAAVNDDLARLTDRRINNEYAATAANVGAAAYRAQYMSAEALARSPEARRDIIVRALGAAERADALRAERASLFQQMAQAPTEAAVAANVDDAVGRELNTFAQYVEVWRPPFVAVICCLIGIFGAWWTLALMQGLNPRDVLRSGWADEAHRIEDKREEEAVTPKPMKPARRRYTDAETGDEIEEVLIQPKQPRPYKKERVIKKGEAFQVNLQPEIPPDETGAPYDGGGRTGSVEQAPAARGAADDDAEEQQPAASAEDVKDSADGIDQTDLSQDLPETPDEDVLAIFDLDEQQDNTEQASADEGEDTATRETPETDERRMIAAE